MTLPSNLPLPAQSANMGINHASSGTSSNSNINQNPDSNLSAASYGSQPSDKELDVSHNCEISVCAYKAVKKKREQIIINNVKLADTFTELKVYQTLQIDFNISVFCVYE